MPPQLAPTHLYRRPGLRAGRPEPSRYARPYRSLRSLTLTFVPVPPSYDAEGGTGSGHPATSALTGSISGIDRASVPSLGQKRETTYKIGHF